MTLEDLDEGARFVVIRELREALQNRDDETPLHSYTKFVGGKANVAGAGSMTAVNGSGELVDVPDSMEVMLLA